MTLPINKLFKGRTLVLLSVTVAVLILDIFFLYALLSSKAKYRTLEGQLQTLKALTGEYLSLKASEKDILSRTYNSEQAPTVRLNELLGNTGLDNKVASVKGLPERQLGRWKVLTIQVQFKNLTIDDTYALLRTLQQQREFFTRTIRFKKQFGSKDLLQATVELFIVKT